MSGLALFLSISSLSQLCARVLSQRRLSALSGPELVEYWLKREHEDDFLKEVSGEQAMTWVKQQNKMCLEKLGDPSGSKLFQDVLGILDSKEKIPHVYKMGEHLYNFWRDEGHPRGIWRRCLLEQYLSSAPSWETVLDVDLLGVEEGESWVFKGSVYCDTGSSSRCMISLSRGGADACVMREFDLMTKQFVATDAFFLPEAKSSVSWQSEDVLLVGTDAGPGSMTASGYPRQARSWRRGQPLADAEVVYEGIAEDISVSQYVSRHGVHRRAWRHRSLTFYTSSVEIQLEGAWVPLRIPEDAEVSQFADQLLISLRTAWAPEGTAEGVRYPAGALLATTSHLLHPMTVLFAPSPSSSLQSYVCLREHLLLHLLDDICARIVFWHYQGGVWTLRDQETCKTIRGISLSAYDRHSSDAYWITVSSFTSPSALYLADASEGVRGISKQLAKTLPRQFAGDYEEVQFKAVSADGTLVPYFVISACGPRPLPALLYGYGGFEISLTPSYIPTVGRGWLEGSATCYAVANIRGGGEYGPAWHQAALRENRQKAYDDFIAVAEDMIARGLTTSSMLGIRGGSNGGLLMGNMLVQRPDLFKAIACAVPLLNMHCYHTLLAGASWSAEYGSAESADDWSFLQRYSPYHNLHPVPSRAYPALLMTTSTKDDRVHPYHARSFAKRLLACSASADVCYYENIEGGHGAAADNKQSAFMDSLYFKFMQKQLCS